MFKHSLCAWLKGLALGLVALILLGVAWGWWAVNHIPSAINAGTQSSAGVLIDNVRVLSMAGEARESSQLRSVLVMGDRIIEIAAAGAIKAPANVHVIDGAKSTLMPGLIDAHIHLNDETELAAYLAHGVTGVRNMSGYPFHLRLIKRLKSQELLGPDIITTGPILNSPGPNNMVLQTTVSSADDAQQAVQAQFDAGYRHLKVYSNLTPEAFNAIMAKAQTLGMSVTGHSPEGERVQGVPYQHPFEIPWVASLGRGFVTYEHIETIVWHGLRDDLNPIKMRDLALKLAASGEAVTPTIYAHQRLVSIAQSQGDYLNRPNADLINPLTTWFSQGAIEYWSKLDASDYEAPHAEFFRVATGILHEAEVPLLTGTDSGAFGIIPGESVARELELLVASGLSPYEALLSATKRSADLIGFSQTGMIAPGYRANLILLPTDPLVEIGAVEKPSGVMIRGKWLDEPALAELKAAARDAKTSTFIRSLVRVIEMKIFGL